MHRLVIMRHAKSETHAGSDHARRLTERGLRDAEAAGRWMRAESIVPDLALVSSAARARATFDGVCEGLRARPESRVLDSLYDASAASVLEECLPLADSIGCVLVVAHNPTMAQLVHDLQRHPDGGTPHLPTAGLAVLEHGGSWADLEAGRAELVGSHVARG